MKKLLVGLTTVSMALSGVAVASAEEGTAIEDGAAIEIAYNLTTEDFAVFEGIVNDFSEETGVQVTIYNGGDDYESAMKTRMSSNDLPDMWTTHGWSLIRYSEYMMDLSDQPWVADIDAAPIEIAMGDAYDAYAPEDIWPTLLSNSDLADNSVEALQDGSFDWDADGRTGFEMLGNWLKAGYFNEDFVSCTKDDVCRAMANGEGAFSLYSTEMIPSLTTIELDDTHQSAYTANAFKAAQEAFDGDLVYDNFFDREYLPSGMWSVMGDSVQVLLSDGDPDGCVDEAITMVADNYNDLMGN